MKQNLWYRIFQNTGLVIISLGLLYGGIKIIRLQLPFWSLFYGLTAIGMGVIMTLIAFNELAQSKNATINQYHEIPCSNCGRMTLVPTLTQKTVCPDCQVKFIRKVQTGIIIFLLLILPAIYHLTRLTQQITQKAQVPTDSPICESGNWQPQRCRCGVWDSNIFCLQHEMGRKCLTGDYCCIYLDNTWKCRLIPSSSAFPENGLVH